MKILLKLATVASLACTSCISGTTESNSSDPLRTLIDAMNSDTVNCAATEFSSENEFLIEEIKSERFKILEKSTNRNTHSYLLILTAKDWRVSVEIKSKNNKCKTYQMTRVVD